MSASREKKMRQELAAQGIPDIKAIRAEEEKKQQRRSNLLYGSIAAIFVLVAAALLIWNSNIIQRSSIALSVDGVKYTAAEVEYYYNSAYNSVANGDYAAYMSLDTSLPPQQQKLTDMDLMFLGISLPEGKEEMTWYEYFMDSAKQTLISQTAVVKAAEAEGFTFTEAMEEELQSTFDTIALYAKTAGTSSSAYIKSMFGPNMTAKTFEKLLRNAILVAHFQEEHYNAPSYSLSDLEEYYSEHKNNFDVSSYEYVYFKGTAPSKTDADGKTVAATDEENAAAKAKAEAAAKDALARYQAGESLEEIAKDYEDIASYYKQEQGSYSSSVVQTWVYDEARVAGDKAMLESGSTYYVAGFFSRSRNDYLPVNVRHILLKVDTSALDSKAENYEELLKVLVDASAAEAQKVLDEWKSGAKTAESFAELAKKHSADGGSNTNGGLYNNVAKGEMVPEFDAWIYDEARKVGDTDIIFVEAVNYTGHHVMYFDGFGETPYWQLEVENTIRNEEYSEWYASLNSGLTAEEHSGIKYVG